MGELLATTALSMDLERVDMILPVPLHLKRLRQRGFNQAALLCRFLGKRLGVPVRYDVLFRGHWTDPQTRLDRKQRHANVKNAFHVAAPGIIQGSSLLLVDDVFTTGSTVNECARSLRKAGAGEVTVLTVARALPDRKEDWGNADGKSLDKTSAPAL